MSAEIRTAKPLPRLTRLVPYCPLPHGCALRPTFYGFVYLGMVLALLLGSINYNNNLGYLLTFLLGGLLLVSLRQTYFIMVLKAAFISDNFNAANVSGT